MATDPLTPAQEARLREAAAHLTALADGRPVARPDDAELRLLATSLLQGSADDPEHYLHRELRLRLRHDAKLLDWLDAGSLDGLWFWDLEHPEHEWLSPRFKEVFGYEVDEIPHSSQWWQDHIFAEDLAPVLEMFDRHVREGAPYDRIVRYRHKDGSTRWVRCRGLVLRDDDGKPVRMLGAHTDVTALKQMEEQLRQRNEMLRQRAGEGEVQLQKALHDLQTQERQQRELLDGLPQLVWSCDADGSCDYLGHQWVDYTGIPEQEQLGAAWLQQVHPDDRAGLADEWQRSVSTGGPLDVMFRIRRHDGTYRWFKTRATPLRDTDGKVIRWFGSNTDIDEQVALERFLRERTAELERSNRDLEQFAFAASHDLREPLRKVRLLASMASEEIGDSDTDANELLEQVDRSGARMLGLIDSLMAFSRLRDTRERWHDVDLDELLQDVTRVLDESITETRAEIRAGSLGVLRCDREQIYRLFLNLMTNSLKFRKPDEPPRIEIDADRDEEQLTLRWRDHGHGFPAGSEARAFEMFARFHTRSAVEGSGLGLAAARKVVELHGGTIQLQSEPERGATFTIRIPLRDGSRP